MAAPLRGLKVLDMSRVLAGPWAGQLLGDYGADVVKVERPSGGDDTRHWGPPWFKDRPAESAYFLAANRNKRSITVDISASAGQDIIRELAIKADVLIENFKVGTMQRFGLAASDLLRVNPRLIYCSISAFGQTGERASEPGYDAMMQASAGLMSITGAPDAAGGSPQKVGVAISDIMAGMYATTAMLAALQARTETGGGQHIDVPLYDSQVAWLANQSMNFLVGGTVPGRMGTAHPNLVPYQAFASSDGSLMLAVGNDQQFARCCDALGCPQLAEDPLYSSMSQRIENRESLIPLLAECFSACTTDEWLTRLREADVPAGAVNSIDEVLTNKHAEERQLVRELRNVRNEAIPTVSNPVLFEQTPVQYTHAPPSLGEHTDEVLRDWLGYSDADILLLRKRACI